MSGSFIRGRTNQQSLDEVAEVTGGAIHVTNTGVAGSSITYVMFTSTTFANNDVVKSATGYKQVIVKAPEATLADVVAVAFSTSADDETALGVVLAAATNDTTGWGKSAKEATITPLPNVVFLSNSDPVTITWDGTTRIKTICTLVDTTVTQVIATTIS